MQCHEEEIKTLQLKVAENRVVMKEAARRRGALQSATNTTLGTIVEAVLE